MLRDLCSQARRIGLCLLPSRGGAVQLARAFVLSQSARQVASIGQTLGKAFADLPLDATILQLDRVRQRLGQHANAFLAVTELPVQSTENGCLLFIVSSLHDELSSGAHA